MTEVFDGIDVSLSARLPHGILFSGGTATGRTKTNDCFVVDSPQQLVNCNVTPPFQTQLKGFVVYPLPWWGLQTSAAFQHVPGPQILANYTATNAQIAPSLGRNLSAGINGTATNIPLIAPGTMYGAALNQLDLRFSATLRSGRMRLQPMIDLFNLFNASPILSQNNTYGASWQTPQSILQGRLIKFGAQLDF
jgi:hypothetical protein